MSHASRPVIDPPARLGVAVQGLGGAVSTTAIAGLSLLRQGLIGPEGLPLAGLDRSLTAGLAEYDALQFAGWDLHDTGLTEAARRHGVLDPSQIDAAAADLDPIRPWPAIANKRFSPAVQGGHVVQAGSHREAVERVRHDLRRFREEARVDAVVLLNVSSTEISPDPDAEVFQTPEAFARGIDANDERINPAAVYCYAAILEGVPHVNFTPSTAADLAALRDLAADRGVPVGGKDGKTGQTLMKTVLAPMFRDRALRVEGWFSTNIFGNRDAEALRDAEQLASKLRCKAGVLDSILGYHVENHLVNINYYKPRGDAKEAWDNIDVVGFAGQKMQLKVNFLCRDSVLAAPLAIELVRLIDLARRRGEGGVQEQLGCFFKCPLTRDGGEPVHDFFEQWAGLLDWLREGW